MLASMQNIKRFSRSLEKFEGSINCFNNLLLNLERA